MTSKKREVLKLFKKDPEKSLSTSYIARKIYGEEYRKVLEILEGDFPTKNEEKKAKRLKSKIHRRILHHLNSMVDKDILKVVKRGESGEKFFGLDIKPGEEIIFEDVKKNRVGLKKSAIPSLPIQSLEKEGVVHKYGEQRWITNLDSVMLESKKFSKNNLHQLVSICLDSVEDVVCLNSFEHTVSEFSTEELNSFLKKVGRDLEDYDKTLSVVIDFSRLKLSDRKKLLRAVQDYKGNDSLNMVFEVTSKVLKQQRNFLENLLPLMNGLPVFFKNKDSDNVPTWVGSLGTYSFEREKWESQKEKGLMANALCSSQSTLIIDFRKFLESRDNVGKKEFKKLFEQVYRSLFTGATIQRKQKNKLFNQLTMINEKSSKKELFIYSRNYIRLYNTEAIAERFDRQTMLDLLGDIRQEVGEFCAAESTIYKSCGMPIEFKIALARCGCFSSVGNLSENLSKKLVLTDIQDIYNDSFRQEVSHLQKESEIYGGSENVKVVRKGNPSPSDMLDELIALTNTFGFDLFMYGVNNSFSADSSIRRFL